MKLFSREEFASRRRGAQDKYATALNDAVTEGLASRDFDRAVALAAKMFREAYESDTDAKLNADAFNGFVSDVRAALDKSTPQSDVTATSLMLALAALNASAIAAADADDMDLELEWVDMDDQAVRETHREAAGQTRAAGVPFSVGGAEMDYPGDPKVAIDLWINCRCVLRPHDPAPRMAAALEAEPLMAALIDDRITLPLTAAASNDAEPHTSMVVVALPKADSPIHAVGDEQKHVTLAYMGDFGGDPQAVHSVVENVLAPAAPFTAAVSGSGQLGPDKAKVLFVEHPTIAGMRAALESDETTAAAMAGADVHPHFVPHMTVDYADMPDEALALSEIDFDRVAVWHGEEQTEYPLGLALPEAPPLAEVAAAVDDEVVTPPVPDVNGDPEPPQPPDAPGLDDAGGQPVHGVIAPEGVPSGDGRGFREGSLTNRPLPLPGTWQDRTAEAHDDASVVFMIEKIQVIDGLQHWSGHLRTTPDADQFLGLLVDFGGRYGLSVDADMAAGEYDDAEEMMWFDTARTCGAAAVNVPAFHEAYIALGPHPILDAVDDIALLSEVHDDAPALVAGGAFLARAVQQFKDLAPGKTEDGPGWVTHPVDTDRLRDYWVRGEGAAKIGWGTPGDFNRCRVNLAEYVKPEFLNGYCANRHYDALGVWPGREAANAKVMAETPKDEAPSVSLVASAGAWSAPSEWFDDPQLDKPTGVVITPEGRTFGHIATWGECHIGLPGVCTAPPASLTDYAYFKTGMVPTRDGSFAEVGQLTIGAGHASDRLGYRGAAAHYDNTCSVWADVNVGEDAHGIWFAGSVRPNITEDMVYAARASGRLSGDWRDIHGNLELTAALTVNVPGFPIPKVGIATEGGRQTALVAAGVVPVEVEPESSDTQRHSIDGVTMTPREFAAEVVKILEEREAVKELTAALTSEGGR